MHVVLAYFVAQLLLKTCQFHDLSFNVLAYVQADDHQVLGLSFLVVGVDTNAGQMGIAGGPGAPAWGVGPVCDSGSQFQVSNPIANPDIASSFWWNWLRWHVSGGQWWRVVRHAVSDLTPLQ